MAQIEICLASDSRYLTQNIRTVCAAGIDSIELCSQMAQQGLSVSAEALRQARAACNSHTQLRVMLRPRAGNFIYSLPEQQQIQAQLLEAAKLGADGIVVGALTADAQPDLSFLTGLLQQCHKLGLSCTFHRAFDAIHDQTQALDQLINLGVDRVLSAGTLWGSDLGVMHGLDRLLQLKIQAAGRIELVVGGGVSLDNLAVVTNRLRPAGQLWSVHSYSAVFSQGRVDPQKVAAMVRLCQ